MDPNLKSCPILQIQYANIEQKVRKAAKEGEQVKLVPMAAFQVWIARGRCREMGTPNNRLTSSVLIIQINEASRFQQICSYAASEACSHTASEA